MKNALLAFVFFVLALVVAPRAMAYAPPPMTAHVTDTAGKLTEEQRLALDKKLEDYRLRTTNEIAVFIPKSLEGDDIEDVANTTARAWKLGTKEKGNGVLLVIAPAERKARIETNTGIQGALTDLQANDIIRQKIRPHLAPGHEDYAAAAGTATDAIMADLDAGSAGGGAATAPAPKPASAGDVLFGLLILAFILGFPILVLVLIVRGFVSAFSSNGRSASTGWASGSSWSNDSSWSGSDSSWSGGGGGDSGFTGGGSSTFDGGGSSDSF